MRNIDYVFDLGDFGSFTAFVKYTKRGDDIRIWEIQFEESIMPKNMLQFATQGALVNLEDYIRENATYEVDGMTLAKEFRESV